MSLLNDIFEHPLEPGYADVAARRAQTGEASTQSRRISLLLLATSLLIALLFTMASSQLRRSADVLSAERSTLLARIQDYSNHTDDLEHRVANLEQENVRLQANQLQGADSSRELAESLARVQAVTGTVAVVGPGVEITVDNPPQDANGSRDPQDISRVLDVDLQRVVNGLWAAGAEAVSINGQRLTALSAIRSANDVVLVNYRPLNPPYSILAVGDPKALAARFLDGSGGQWLQTISSLYSIKFEVSTEDNLKLPGRTGGTLRHVDLGDDQ